MGAVLHGGCVPLGLRGNREASPTCSKRGVRGGLEMLLGIRKV